VTPTALRRAWLVAWLALAPAAMAAAPGALAAPPPPAAPLHALAVGPIGLTVSDLDRSVAFYTTVLAFHEESERELTGDAEEQLSGVFAAHARTARLALGDEEIELTEYLAPRGRPRPAEARSNDRFFQHVAIIVSDMSQAYAALRTAHVEFASSAPQRLPDWNPNAGGIEAFYFRDPDGHPLEVLHFPPGKGDPKWQRANGRLFLGIDHTAIVIADTDKSLAFYRDVLGMRVVGHSENYGPEQEHLNAVFGAHLKITALRADKGPGIEFLQYVAPTDGRAFPTDEHANDLVHWQTQIAVASAGGAWDALALAHAPFVSSGVTPFADGAPGFHKGLLARDPDGHVLEVIER
jgi:catechol 2,3-dioxygenase-like lactoylglutathione lyase family enzyme